MATPQSPSNSPASPGAAQPAASRGDELLPGVGHTMYEFQGQSTGPGMGETDLGLSMGRPQRSNLGSGRGAGWIIGLLVVAGAAAAFWMISGGMGVTGGAKQENSQAADKAVAGESTQAKASPGTQAPAANAGDTQVEASASSIAADKAKAEQEAAAKAKAEQEAAEKAKAEAAAKKKAEAEAKKKAEQAAKDAAAAKAKADKAAAAKKRAKTPAKRSTKKPGKKSSKVKRIKPRPKNSGLDGLPDPD